MTTALVQFKKQMEDVNSLISLHPNRQPTASVVGAGRPSGKLTPLLRSCVLLTYAAWEVYVEDSAVAAVTAIARQTPREQLPDSLRQFVTQSLTGDPWVLAGEGWREILVVEATRRVRGNEENGEHGINTAGPRQVVALHQELFGEKLLNNVMLGTRDNVWVKSELAQLVKIRGSIAHTGKTPGTLNLKGVEQWRDYIMQLAGALDALLDGWVKQALAVQQDNIDG